MELKQLFKKHTLACIAGGFVFGVAATGIGMATMSFSGSPAFCGYCHSMKSEAAAFSISTHSRLDCTDCHLPHDNMAIYLMEKGRTGMLDTYHEVLRDYPAHIKLSARARTTVNANCLRCHENTMRNVHAEVMDMDTGDCMKCHSRIAHGSNHLEGGIKVE